MQRRKMGAAAFQQIVGFRNLDELTRKNRHVLLSCAQKRLPRSTRENIHRPLCGHDPQQFDMYEQIQTPCYGLLDSGEMSTAPAVITQMLRLQQIMSGHLKTDDGDMLYFPSKRMDALEEIINEHDGKAIIWSRFRYDIQQITETLNKKFGQGCAVSYYGDTSDDDRANAVLNFQNPDHPLKFFVGNPATAGYGLTLTEANLVVYYANDFNLETRIQSEDRAHRIGQKNNVTYIDLICEGSIDERSSKPFGLR